MADPKKPISPQNKIIRIGIGVVGFVLLILVLKSLFKQLMKSPLYKAKAEAILSRAKRKEAKKACPSGLRLFPGKKIRECRTNYLLSA